MAADPRVVTIVGAGELTASSYLPAAAQLGWKVALVDRDLERARRLAARHRRIVHDVRASTEEVDAIAREGGLVIATPARTHAELAHTALGAGFRRILLEKPPTMDRREYGELIAAADAAGATIKTSFLRRDWDSLRSARTSLESWTARFGPLKHVSLIDGSPWGWKAVATRERGAAGLEEILVDELSHGFDSLFYVTGWDPPSALTLAVDTSTLWEFRGTATGLGGKSELTLDVVVSRTEVLANAVVLELEGAAVAVEYAPAGGVCVRPHGARPELIEGPSALPSVAERFATILEGAFTSKRSETTPSLSEWEGPITLISGFRDVRPDRERVEAAG